MATTTGSLRSTRAGETTLKMVSSTTEREKKTPKNVFGSPPLIQMEVGCESYDHRKQGLNFTNDDNIRIKEMRKDSVGTSMDNFESALQNIATPHSRNSPDAHRIVNHHQIRSKINAELSQGFQLGNGSDHPNNPNEFKSSERKQLLESQQQYLQQQQQQQQVGSYYADVIDLQQDGYSKKTSFKTFISNNNSQVMLTKNMVQESDRSLNHLRSVNSQSNIGQQPTQQGAGAGAQRQLLPYQNSIESGKQKAKAFGAIENKTKTYESPDRQNFVGNFDSSLPNPNALMSQSNSMANNAFNPLLSVHNSPVNGGAVSVNNTDLIHMKSGYGTDALHSSDVGMKDKNRNKSQTVTSSSKNAYFSMKFLISIKPRMRKFMLNRTSFGRTRMMSNRILSYINDSVDYMKRESELGLVNNFLFMMARLFKWLHLDRIPLFDPESKLKIVINSIIVTYNLFYMLFISVELIFDAHIGDMAHTFTYIAMGSWITEMIVEMNTACYHDNHFITDRKVIIQIYAKEYFFFEILPLIFEGRTSEDTFINVLLHLPLLLKIKGMSIILQKLEFYILQILEKHYIFQLFKLIMQMLLYGHIVACLWNLVVKIENNLLHSNNWVEQSLITSEHWWERYLLAQYWAFSVMMNVTTQPTTAFELGFTSFVMLMSCIAFGYLLSTVAGIIDELNKQQKDYKKDLNILNSYMKRKKVDLGIKRRVNIDLKTYYQQKSRDNMKTESEALSKLSHEMLYELNVQANSRILKQFPFFTKLFSEQTITKMYLMMEEEVYAPQQVILTKANGKFTDQNYLYLIVKGEVNITIENFIAANQIEEDEEQEQQSEESYDDGMNGMNNQTVMSLVRKVKNSQDKSGPKRKIACLKSGQIFGAQSFFTGTDQAVEFQCKEFTTIIKISRIRFLDIIKDNKKDYERFIEIKDKMISHRIIEEIPDQECMVCGGRDHPFENCNFGHFDKMNILLFFKHNFSTAQPRGSGVRRFLKNGNTLSIKAKLNQQISEFRCQNEFEFFTSEGDEDNEYEDSQVQSYISEGNGNKQKGQVKNVNKFMTVEEENSKLAFSSHIVPNQSPIASQKMYPSDIEISRIERIEEETQKMKIGKQSQGQFDQEEGHQFDEITQNSMNAMKSPSGPRRMSYNRQPKPRSSFVKFNDNQGNNNPLNNGSANLSSHIGNATGSSNNIRRQSGQNDMNEFIHKKKLSFIIASPQMGGTSGGEAMMGNNLDSDYHQQQPQAQQHARRRTFVQHAPMNHNGSSTLLNSSHYYHMANQGGYNNNNNNKGISYQTSLGQSQHSNAAGNLLLSQNQNFADFGQVSDPMVATQFTRGNTTQTGLGRGINHSSVQQQNYRKTITMAQMQIDDHTLIWGFDKQKDFLHYFPYYNCQNVMRRLQYFYSKGLRNRKIRGSKKPTEIQMQISNNKQRKSHRGPLLLNGIDRNTMASSGWMKSLNRTNSASGKTTVAMGNRMTNNDFNLNVISAELNSKQQANQNGTEKSLVQDKISKNNEGNMSFSNSSKSQL